MRVGEGYRHSRVGWAGALEAPSRGRCGMVPSVTVAVETVALRRAAREQKPPIKCVDFTGFRHRIHVRMYMYKLLGVPVEFCHLLPSLSY